MQRLPFEIVVSTKQTLSVDVVSSEIKNVNQKSFLRLNTILLFD